MNSKIVFRLTFYLAIASWLWVSVASAQDLEVADSSSDINSLRQVIEELESSVGMYDSSLTEPLQQLADSLMNAGQFAEAQTTLDKATQVVRVNEGLYTGSQLPLLQMKIENFANSRDWDRSRQQMDYAISLLSSGNLIFRGDTADALESLLDGLMFLSTSHLRAIAEDHRSWQDFHFRRALSINRAAQRIAELYWGENDPRMAAVLYHQVKHYHLQSVAVDLGGTTGYKLRKLMPSLSQIRDRSVVQQEYYFRGLFLLNRIKEIFANSEPPDKEALALSDLYIADWHVLFSRGEAAILSYQQSYQGLLDANIAPEVLDNFFDHPTVLPQPEFHTSMSAALETKAEEIVSNTGAVSNKLLPNLSFTEWSPGFPNVQAPLGLSSDDFETPDFASFSIDLAGIERKSFRINGRYRTAVSVVDGVELISRDMSSSMAELELEQKLYWLRFRPVLVGGVPQPTRAILNYFFASAD